MKRNILLGRVTAALLLASTALQPVFAQDQTPQQEDDGGIQEIVVTAQKRAENAQDVPIAISVFSGDDLAERAVGNVSQLSAVAPNVNFDNGVGFTGSTAVLAASIRGIGSSDFAFNIDPGVGIYVDGIFLARSVGANQDLLDTGRIEVLKGPQGTLFGRNTIGGAVSIVTRDPGKKFRFVGDITYGRFNLFQGRGSVDIPLSDSLSSSLTFDVKTRDGHAQRLPFPSPLVANSASFTALPQTGFDSPSREGAETNGALRAKLKYDDGGNFRVTLSGDYQRNTGTQPYTLLQVLGDPAATGNPNFTFLYNTCRAAPPGVLGSLGLLNFCSTFGTQFQSIRRDEVTNVPRVFYNPGVNTAGNPARNELLFTDQFITGDPDRSFASGNNFSRLRNWGATINAELDLGSNLLLKSISGYRGSRWLSGLDADGSPLNIFQLSFDQRQRQFSQEFQLVGRALNDKLNYVVGAYFFNENGYLLDLVSFAGGAVQIDGPNWLNTTNYAAFSQLDYKVNDLLSFTIGGRYTRENKSFEGGQQEVNGVFYKLVGSVAFAGTPLGDVALSNICADTLGNVFPNARLPFPGNPTCAQILNYPTPGTNPLRVYPAGINRQKFNNFSPKFGVQLHPSEDVLIYASLSKGYKTGGWTTRFTTPQTVVADFGPEKATTYELGVKSTLLNRKLQINASVFQTNYRAIQLNYQVGTSPTIDNVGDARIIGFEIDVIARPTRTFSINAAVGYINAEYTSLDPAVQVTSAPNSFQAGAVVGADLPKTPNWKINLGPRFDFPLGNGGEISLIGDYTYTSKQRNNVEGTLIANRPSTNVINASIRYAAPDEKYNVTFGGTNLTNDRFVTSVSSIPAAGLVSGAFSRPIEWYLRVGVNF